MPAPLLKTCHFLRSSYFYLSTVIVWAYPFWFGIDFFKDGYPSVTSFLELYGFWFIIPSLLGVILKALFDSNIYRQLSKEKSKNERLNSDIVELSEALKDLSNDILRDFFREKLDSDNGGTVTRISLYVSDTTNRGLYCVSRYSKNQTCCSISSNKIYGANGIIGKVWNNGNEDGFGICDNLFPDPTSHKGRNRYARRHIQEYQLTQGEVDVMKMKSRFYYAYRVQSESNNLGVILIESHSSNKYTKQEIDNVIKELERRILIVLKSTKNYLGQPLTYSNNQL